MYMYYWAYMYYWIPTCILVINSDWEKAALTLQQYYSRWKVQLDSATLRAHHNHADGMKPTAKRFVFRMRILCHKIMALFFLLD